MLVLVWCLAARMLAAWHWSLAVSVLLLGWGVAEDLKADLRPVKLPRS